MNRRAGVLRYGGRFVILLNYVALCGFPRPTCRLPAERLLISDYL